MRVYLYNSYKGSPVGFIMGVMEELPEGGFTELTESGIPDSVRACFEYGIIKNVLGNTDIFKTESEENTFLLLLKNLTCKADKPEDDFTWYLNIALETNDKELMEKWLASDGDKNVGCLFSQCFEIDKSNNFGYQVNGSKLLELLNTSFASSVINEEVKKAFQDACCFNFQNKLPGKEQHKFLNEYFKPVNEIKLTPLTHASSDWVRAEKKTSLKLGGLWTMAVLLLLITIGGAIWMLTDKENNQIVQTRTAEMKVKPSRETWPGSKISDEQSSQFSSPKRIESAWLRMRQNCLPAKMERKGRIELEIHSQAFPSVLPGLLIYEENQVRELKDLLPCVNEFSCHCEEGADASGACEYDICRYLLFCNTSIKNEMPYLTLIIDTKGLQNKAKKFWLLR